MSDNYRKDSKEYCRREEKSGPTSGAYIRASTFALPDGLAIKGCPDGRDGVKMARACVLHLSLTVALVPPVARLPSHVVCGGAAYDYCIQALGCTVEEAGKAERALLPNIAANMTRAQADERCSWLRSSLELSDAELKRLVMRNPQVLGLSVKSNIEPKIDWLQSRLDLDAVQLRKIVLQPRVLGYNIEDNIAPKLDWLQKRLALDAGQLRKIVRLPAVLGYGVEDNMAPKLDWLQGRLDLDEEELKRLVVAHPHVLGYSIEDNLEPQLGFFEQELGLAVSDVRAGILSSPARLSYSLKKRYRPRLEVCRAAGIDASLVFSYSTQTDEQFCKRVGVPLAALRAAQEDV